MGVAIHGKLNPSVLGTKIVHHSRRTGCVVPLNVIRLKVYRPCAIQTLQYPSQKLEMYSVFNVSGHMGILEIFTSNSLYASDALTPQSLRLFPQNL